MIVFCFCVKLFLFEFFFVSLDGLCLGEEIFEDGSMSLLEGDDI